MKSNVIKKVKVLPASDLYDLNDNKIVENKEVFNIGDKLRKARVEKKLSIKDIANTLRIGEQYLHAIEHMDCKALPERVYSLGYVRSYSIYLGLDPQEIVNQFKIEIYGNYQAELLALPEPVVEMSRANWKIILVCTVVIGIIIFSWYQIIHKKRVPEPAKVVMAAHEIAIKEPALSETAKSPATQIRKQLVNSQRSLIDNKLKPTTQNLSSLLSVPSVEEAP